MNLHVTTRRPLLPLTFIVLISCLHSVTGQLTWVPIPDLLINLDENTPVGTIVTSSELTGGDGLQVVSDNSNTKVNITSTGPQFVRFNILLNTNLDYDYGPHVVLCSISGTNGAQDQHKSLQIKILVQNINDETPELKNQPYSVTVPENTQQNTVVYTRIVAIDPDLNDVVYYSLSTTGEDVFAITDNGSLVLRGALDFETVRFYHYIVTATDKVGHNVSADVFITVEDVQDTPPYFTGEPFQAKIYEDKKTGDSFLTIRAADGDRGVSNNITLNIINETCKGLFEINPTSGELKLKSTADRDVGDVNKNNGICTLEVQATEDKQHPQVGGSYTATTSVTVTILDIDDNVPKFSRASYNLSVDENTQRGVPINLNTPITVSDADQGTNAEFEVRVISLQDYFEVTPSRIQSTGDILIRVKNSTILDYEASDLLTLELEASDTSQHGKSSNATVTIHINNVNDNSPVFSNSTFYATVPENSPLTKYVTTVTATDADKHDGINDYGKVRYTLQGSDSSFKIDSISGEVTVDTTGLDREKKNVYYLTVVAEDGGHIKTNALLEITVSDENDETPFFVTKDYQTSLKEGATTFIPLVTVHATDQDDPNSPNSEIFYKINSTLPQGLETYFGLDSHLGTLTVQKPLEFERVNFLPGEVGSITLIIEAKDNGSPALSSTVSVAVNLQDINNNNPVFHQPQYTAQIYENSTKITPMPVTKPTTTTDITTTTDTTTTTDITTESWTPANQTASTDKPPTVRQDFQCHLTYMEVFIPVELVPNSVLTLRDPSPSCKLTNNGTHHTISFSYDECGTSETFYPNIVNVQNEISVHLDFNDTTEITFVDDYTIPLQCTVDRSKTLNGAIQVLPREGIAEHIVQSSEFYMKEFTTAEYNVEITDYPVKVPLNRQVFFELAVTNRTSSSTGIRVENCDASPTPDLNDTTSVSLIRDGCPDNPAVKVQPSVGIDRFRFSSQAFHFSAPANINNLVYVHCTVSTCRSECDITCPPRVRRKRRSAGRRLASAFLTSGSHVVVNEG